MKKKTLRKLTIGLSSMAACLFALTAQEVVSYSSWGCAIYSFLAVLFIFIVVSRAR